MNVLTPLEIQIRHGTCNSDDCPICGERPFQQVVGGLKKLGLTVRNYIDDHTEGFASVTVEEDNALCSYLLRGQIPPSSKLSVSEGAHSPAGTPATLQEMLVRASVNAPNKGLVYVAANGEQSSHRYPALLMQAREILTGLQKAGLKAGDKVILQLGEYSDFLPAFWACICGGIVPAPIGVAADYHEINAAVSKLQKTWALLQEPRIVTTEKLAPAILAMAHKFSLKGLRVEMVEQLRRNEASDRIHVSQPDDLALFMMTSGSTGTPKAVILSHRNLVSNAVGVVELMGFTSDEVALNWMPLDHVAGLLFTHFRDVYLGCEEVHVPTSTVLGNPLRWLDEMERFKATVTFAPNFAYALINDRDREIASRKWDLSSVRCFLNGGEAIVPKTARRFLKILAPHGVRSDTMRPAWGMSETSSGVTISKSFDLASTEDADSLVEVGLPIPGFAMRIVDQNDQVLPERNIGRLQVKGVTITKGYYQTPELNAQVFTDDGWFKTGDLALLKNGQLTITGREKDVIIINGVNHHSHEIEAVVESVAGVEVSYAAACAVRDDPQEAEKLAVFFHTEIQDEKRRIALLKEIRLKVSRVMNVNPTYVIPLPKEEIPKTEIGKIQRSRLRERFEAGDYRKFYRSHENT